MFTPIHWINDTNLFLSFKKFYHWIYLIIIFILYFLLTKSILMIFLYLHIFNINQFILMEFLGIWLLICSRISSIWFLVYKCHCNYSHIIYIVLIYSPCTAGACVPGRSGSYNTSPVTYTHRLYVFHVAYTSSNMVVHGRTWSPIRSSLRRVRSRSVAHTSCKNAIFSHVWPVFRRPHVVHTSRLLRS